jgi:hypothetical protein
LRDVTQKETNILWRPMEKVSGHTVTSARHSDTHDKHALATAGPQRKSNQVRGRALIDFSVT